MQKPDKVDYAKLLGFDAVATTFQTASTSKTRPSVPGSAPRWEMRRRSPSRSLRRQQGSYCPLNRFPE